MDNTLFSNEIIREAIAGGLAVFVVVGVIVFAMFVATGAIQLGGKK